MREPFRVLRRAELWGVARTVPRHGVSPALSADRPRRWWRVQTLSHRLVAWSAIGEAPSRRVPPCASDDARRRTSFISMAYLGRRRSERLGDALATRRPVFRPSVEPRFPFPLFFTRPASTFGLTPRIFRAIRRYLSRLSPQAPRYRWQAEALAQEAQVSNLAPDGGNSAAATGSGSFRACPGRNFLLLRAAFLGFT